MTYVMAVDDDASVLETLGRVLRHDGYEVSLMSSGVQALKTVKTQLPDLIILDIIMPEMDGIAICRELRASASTVSVPVLFLTAKGNTEDIVAGLDAGADDYVVKPFELAELRARVAALLRRGTRDRSATVLQLNNLRLDSDTYQVSIDNRTIQLTLTEHRLLRYLMEHPNQAHSPSHLLQMVWEYPPNTGDPDLVRAHVRNLRAKIERGTSAKHIRTIHGVGYMISI
jgi:DNA-binding response OmpR family regulator